MWRVRPDREHAYEVVAVSGEGNFFVTVPGEGLVLLDSTQVEEVCDVCEEAPTADDPLGHFRASLEVCDTCGTNPTFDRTRPYCDHAVLGAYVVAHGQCGLDRELELA
jgi:hypothetical protein